MSELSAKAIVLLGDGAGDRPVPQLQGQTPLEAQATPALDEIAKGGECGLMDPIAPGIPAGSDTAHLSLLGYDPYTYYTGRGPFEARGIGMRVQAGDVAFRCNFATVDDDWTVLNRRAGRIKEKEGTPELAAAVNTAAGVIEGVQCAFKESVEHRGALVLHGEGLDPRVTDADPHTENSKVLEVRAEDPAAAKTARVVNHWIRRTYEALKDHPVNADRKWPANIVLPRGVGVAPHLKPFQAEHAMSGAMIVEVALIQGLGEYLEMDVIRVPGATGGYDTDEMAIAQAVVEAHASHDFVLCNIKCPDLGGHDGSWEKKQAAIAKLDRAAGYLLDHIDFDHTVMVVTADHSTPVAVKDHSGDPVAIVAYGVGTRPDDVSRYGERPCARGGLCRIRGVDVIRILSNLTGAQKKFGS